VLSTSPQSALPVSFHATYRSLVLQTIPEEDKERILPQELPASSQAHAGIHLVCTAKVIGVDDAWKDARMKGGVLNPYDTSNGILLESILHAAFESYQWCMDVFLVVHVSMVGKANGLGQYEGQRMNLPVDKSSYLWRQTLRVRFDRFQKAVPDQRGSVKNHRTRGGRRTLGAFTVTSESHRVEYYGRRQIHHKDVVECSKRDQLDIPFADAKAMCFVHLAMAATWNENVGARSEQQKSGRLYELLDTTSSILLNVSFRYVNSFFWNAKL